MNDILKSIFLPEVHSHWRIICIVIFFISLCHIVSQQHKAFPRVESYCTSKSNCIFISEKKTLHPVWLNSDLSFTLCLSPMPATLLHTLPRSDSAQIPTCKYMFANQSDIMNYFYSPNRDSKMAFRHDSVEEAAVRPLGRRLKRVWSKDVNWQLATGLACHRSILTLAANMFSLFLHVSFSLPLCYTF